MTTPIARIILCLIALFATPSVIFASTLYGSSASDRFHKVDQSTGALTVVGFGNYGNPTDLTSDWRQASFRIWECQPKYFSQVNPTTGVVTPIGTFGTLDDPISIDSIGFDTITGTMYGTDKVNLYTVNVATGAATFVGNTGRTDVNGLAFDLTGTLYSVGQSDEVLLKLNTGSGSASVVGALGVSAMTDLAVRPEDGVMFGTATVGSFSIYRIDLASGGTTLVGPYNYSGGINGLAFSPAPVPEPSLLALTVAALAALPARRRKTVPYNRA